MVAHDSRDNVLEEGKREVMIGYIAGVEHKSTIGAPLFGRCQGDFTVLDHLVTPIYLTDHTHSLSRIGFLHHLPMMPQQDLL